MTPKLALARRHLNHPDPTVRAAAANLEAAEIISLTLENDMTHIPRANFAPIKTQAQIDDEAGNGRSWGHIFAFCGGVIAAEIIFAVGRMTGGWW